jgi:hypothetical protein
MKRKYLFVAIVLFVLLLFGWLLYWLSVAKKNIDDQHIKLEFVIINEDKLSLKTKGEKNNMLKPLLQFYKIEDQSGKEDLIISSVSVMDRKFHIPAQGINCFRYDENSPLNKSNYTSTSRQQDEESFFSDWMNNKDLQKVLSVLNKTNSFNKAKLIKSLLSQNQNQSNDSLIICVSCKQSDYSNIIFGNSQDLRDYVNKNLKDYVVNNKGEITKKSITVFILEGLNNDDQVPPSPNIGEDSDSDGDGVNDSIDKCPHERGLKQFNGCPDDDGDGIINSKDDCPNLKGELRCKGCPCPDQDGDGVSDDVDSCPNEKGSARNKGCPEQSEVKFGKKDPTKNIIKFSSSNIKFKEDDNIQIYFYEGGKKIGIPRKLVPSEIRIGEFNVSGQSLSEQLNSNQNKLYVQLELYLNGKLIEPRSGNITIYCNQ